MERIFQKHEEVEELIQEMENEIDHLEKVIDYENLQVRTVHPDEVRKLRRMEQSFQLEYEMFTHPDWNPDNESKRNFMLRRITEMEIDFWGGDAYIHETLRDYIEESNIGIYHKYKSQCKFRTDEYK